MRGYDILTRKFNSLVSDLRFTVQELSKIYHSISKLFVILILCTYASTSIATDLSTEQVLSDTQSYLIKHIDYTTEEKSLLSQEFVSYYDSQVLPNLAQLIGNTRVIFVNMNPNYAGKEAILVGDTARTSAWGPKNFIAVAIKTDAKWKIEKFQEINATITCDNKNSDCHFQYFTLTVDPKTPNKFLGAVLGYANYGVSGHNFRMEFVGWDQYNENYYIYGVNVPCPVIVDQAYLAQEKQRGLE